MTAPPAHTSTADLQTDGRGALRFLDRFIKHATISQARFLTPRMRQITIIGQDLVGLDWSPGQQVRVMLKDPTRLRVWLSPKEVSEASRTYSLWDYDPIEGRYELIVLDHDGDGPGARWGRTAQTGDPVLLGAPEGKFRPRVPSPYHLFVGDETATVCFGAMLRSLPTDERIYGVVEADDAADHLTLTHNDKLVRVARNGQPASPSQALLVALRALDLPDGPGTAYLAGEARTIQAARRHLIDDRSWNRRSIITKPFWTPAKRGMD